MASELHLNLKVTYSIKIIKSAKWDFGICKIDTISTSIHYNLKRQEIDDRKSNVNSINYAHRKEKAKRNIIKMKI